MAVQKPYRRTQSTGASTANDPIYRHLAVCFVAIVATVFVLALYTVGKPLYWRFYAEVIHRYEPDPALALIQEIEQESGGFYGVLAPS